MKSDSRKRSVASAFCAAVLMLAGAAEAAAARYQLTELGGLSADDTEHIAQATGLNALGHASGNVIGFRDSTGFVDAGGSVSRFSADTYTETLGVNSAGQAVGWSGNGTGTPRRAYRGAGDGIEPIGTLGGDSSEAAAINAAGQVTGAAARADGRTHAFRLDGSTMVDLGTLGGASSRAFGINATGQVTGVSAVASGDGTGHAFLHDGTTMLDLGTLGGLSSRGNDINDAGQVTGAALLADGSSHAFLYSGGRMLDLSSLRAGLGSVGYGINNAGQVTGAATDSFGDAAGAFVYRDGVITDLNSLLDPLSGAGWTLLEGRDINDRGQIVGNGLNADGKRSAFLLTLMSVTAPVPEPQTWALMLGGLGLLGVALRRRGTRAG